MILPYKTPFTLGHDVADVVTKVGSVVSKFKVGDEVYARPADHRIGTFAEFISINENDVAMKPKNIPMEEAATIPLVGLTAWQALVEIANLHMVKEYVSNDAYSYWSLSSIYSQMVREAITFMSLATFRKYAKWINPNLSHRRNRRQISWERLRANAPKQILHMDLTIFRPSDHTRVYIYLVMDNFSRAILGWKASLQYSSDIALKNLKEVCDKYDLLKSDTRLIVDDGPENSGYINEFLTFPGVQLKKQIAPLDIRQSNSMIESVNKRLKYDYLFTKELSNFEAVEFFLPDAIDSYNNKPLIILSAYTPLEVLHGAFPDKYRFKESSRITVTQRKLANQKRKCCVM